MTIEHLRENGLIVLECISGSRAYGLDTPGSDTDIRGVFVQPKSTYYGFQYTPQVSDETNDVVFYELGRFMELLSLNNPNTLELLNTPPAAVLHRSPLLADVRSDLVLSKLCSNTFGRYALSQIKKAKGLKKKMLNPMDKARKSVLAFCYVSHGQGAVPLTEYLEVRGWDQAHCGLTKIPHMRDIYGLYHADAGTFGGVVKGETSNDVRLSAVPKGVRQEALLYFNRDGYSTYCKKYREYWAWVAKRNKRRYENTQSHGKRYDAKNMMHVFRLLEMAIEIGRYRRVNVRRADRDFLLAVKAGEFEYEALLEMAAEKQRAMEEAFTASSLPEKPDVAAIEAMTFKIRAQFYNR